MDVHVRMMARRIRELRGILMIPVDEMARVADCTPEEYERYESGERDMSFTFLYRCATRFGLDISELVTGEMPKLSTYTLCRAGAGMPIKRQESFEYQHIAPLLRNRLSEPFVVTAKYREGNETARIELTSHTGQELDYVLEGRLRMQVDEHIEILGPGDSIYYNAAHPHGMVALDGRDCRFLSVVVKGEAEAGRKVTEDLTARLSPGEDLIYKQFVDETLDENGYLKRIEFHAPDNFNFAYDVVDALARRAPGKIAMTWLSHEKARRDITFREMSRYSAKAANYLTSLGIGKGDRVMIVLKRHVQFWFVILGLHKLGAVAVPATHLLTEKDFDYRFRAAGVKAIICTAEGEVSRHAEAAAKNCPTVETLVSVNGHLDGWRDFDREVELFSTHHARPQGQSADDPMLMYFTSGTVGYPKIATHSFRYPLGHIVTARYWHNVDPDGKHFSIADTGWGKAVWGKLYGQWLCEACVFTYDFERFQAADILPLFAEYGITTFCAPPTMYRFFIKEDLKQYDLSSLKHATIAGEALNPEVFERFREATGLKLMEGFGQTETTLTVANLLGMEPKPGSMGKPNPQYDVDIVTAEGVSTRVGEVGEIILRTGDAGKTWGMATGYYLDDSRTRAVWHDGVYHTGDMAWRDEDGYYWFVGRMDDLIKSSGYRIGPFEIESVIMELPYVLECAVTGVPDEVRGQVVKATIVLVEGTQPGDMLSREIQRYVKERTAPYKYPRIVEFTTELPKTISGKIRRAEIGIIRS